MVDLKATLFGGTDSDYVPRYLDIDPAGGKMYWTDSAGGVIRRANLNGSSVETVVSGFTGAGLRGIAIDSSAGKMYWADFAAQKIQRANLDGSGVQDLITGSASGVRELKLDTAAGKIYWADLGEHAIRRANLDGTNVETLWLGGVSDQPVGIAVDASAGKVYWSNDARDKIMRANLDGSGVETLIDLTGTNSAAHSLAVDARAGKLYFANAVYRANLDGSGVVPIGVPGIATSQGIAIVTPSASVTPRNGLITSESGSTATFQVSLNVPPNANVTIPVSSSNSQEGVVSTSSLTFTPANWNVPQTVTVTGVDDTLLDGNKAYSVILGAATSADANYVGVNPVDASLVNNDNDVPPTKFYVVDDATQNRTYEYGPGGALVESYNVNSGNSAPRGAASTAAGDKVWVVDANRNVYVYNPSGMLLGSWSVSGFNNSAQFGGIAVSGNDVWIVDAKSDKVYRYAGAAGRLSGSQNAASSFSLNSGNKDATDIVTNGVHLWVVNNSTTDKVFKYTLAGSLVGSWTITSGGGSPTGITIDPTNVSDIWIVDSASDRVYQFTAAASRTSGSQSPAASFALAAGNTNPQGIADPPAPSRSGMRQNSGAPKHKVSAPDAASVQQLFAEPDAKNTWTRKSRIRLIAI